MEKGEILKNDWMMKKVLLNLLPKLPKLTKNLQLL